MIICFYIIIGPEDTDQSSFSYQDSLRGYFMTDKESGFAHSSQSIVLAEEVSFFHYVFIFK